MEAERLLDEAETQYRAGLVGEAVRSCREAAAHTDHPDHLVRAALLVGGGAGGVELGSVIVDLCDQALRALTADAVADRIRVRAQREIALSEVIGARDMEGTTATLLAEARQCAEPRALALALRARQHAISGPAGADERLALGRQLLPLAEQTQSPEDELWGALWQIDSAFEHGDIAMVNEQLGRLGLLDDRLDWPVASWHRHRLLAARSMFLGDLETSGSELELARRAAERTGDPMHRGLLGIVDFALCDLLGTLAGRVDQLRQFATGFGLVPVATATAGYFLLRAGDHDAARGCYEQVRPLLDRLPADGRWFWITSGSAEMAIAFGDINTVRWCYQALLPYAGQFMASGGGTFICVGAVDRELGRLAAASDRVALAREHLEDAIRANDRAGAVPYRTWAELDLAKILSGTGASDDVARARDLAERAAATARRIGMATAHEDAERILAALRDDDGAPLTAREREVLGMLARGASNRSMADALVLSERTVEFHVANAIAKLGVANRTQAATWALEHGLAIQ